MLLNFTLAGIHTLKSDHQLAFVGYNTTRNLEYLTFKDSSVCSIQQLARQSTMTLQVDVCKMFATALMWRAEVCHVAATANRGYLI